MIVVDKYKYKELPSETDPSGPRVYLTPSGHKVPSVTTILSGTKDMTFLKEWRERVGNHRANDIVQRSTKWGTSVHKNLEDFIVEGKQPEGNIFVKHMTKKIIENGLKKVDEFWGCEVQLYAENLYAGTADGVGIHEGKPAIIDFKNSRSLRKDEWVTDYKLQVVAYALAHNEMFGTDIKRGVVMLATQDGHYQEWIIEGNDFEQAATEWAQRVEDYYSKM
jgi:genome maintenance exonuclease 1